MRSRTIAFIINDFQKSESVTILPFDRNSSTSSCRSILQDGTNKNSPVEQNDAGCSKRSSNEAAGESQPEAYPLGYVEDCDEPRTKLGTFFSSLLGFRLDTFNFKPDLDLVPDNEPAAV